MAFWRIPRANRLVSQCLRYSNSRFQTLQSGSGLFVFLAELPHHFRESVKYVPIKDVPWQIAGQAWGVHDHPKLVWGRKKSKLLDRKAQPLFLERLEEVPECIRFRCRHG